MIRLSYHVNNRQKQHVCVLLLCLWASGLLCDLGVLDQLETDDRHLLKDVCLHHSNISLNVIKNKQNKNTYVPQAEVLSRSGRGLGLASRHVRARARNRSVRAVSASARGWRPQSSSGARVTARPPEERVSRAAEAEQGPEEARKASGTEIEPLSSVTSAWTPPETRSSAYADTCSGTADR